MENYFLSPHLDTPTYLYVSGGCRNSVTDYVSVHFLSNIRTEWLVIQTSNILKVHLDKEEGGWELSRYDCKNSFSYISEVCSTRCKETWEGRNRGRSSGTGEMFAGRSSIKKETKRTAKKTVRN